MSNLKQQIAVIRQQLVVSTAETVARFARVEDHLERQMHDGFQELRQAITDQSTRQQSALEQLLELVAEDSESTENAIQDLRARVARLEGDRPPAA